MNDEQQYIPKGHHIVEDGDGERYKKSPQKRQSRSVVAVGYQACDGTIIVTNVLCTNFPDMTDEELAALSWKLTQWCKKLR